MVGTCIIDGEGAEGNVNELSCFGLNGDRHLWNVGLQFGIYKQA